MDKMLKVVFSIALVSLILFSGCAKPVSQPKQNIVFKEIPKFKNYGELSAAFANANEGRNYGAMDAAMGIAALPFAVAQIGNVQYSMSKSAENSGFSTTNIQVEGVDEADIVKTDGDYIYAFAKNKLYIIDSKEAGNEKVISTTNFAGNGLFPIEMFVNNDKLLLFASTSGYYRQNDTLSRKPYFYGNGNTTVLLYDISDRTNPVQEKKIEFSGSYLTSRLARNNAVFVINSQPYGGYYGYEGQKQDSNNIIPLMVEDGVQKTLSESTDVGYLYPMPARSFVTIASLNLDSKNFEKQTIAASAESVFASADNIYIASTAWLPPEPVIKDNNFESHVRNFIYGDQKQTVINKFNFNGGKINFVGQGIVPGYVLNQFSMDEFEGNFRVATTKARVSDYAGSSSNNLYVLDSEMNTLGKLEDLAPGEKIYSARFMGPRAYMVTFKKVDPLFVIDLSDPKDPKVLGKLKIPGYSDYLHPIDENHIIGIGKDTIESGYGNFAWYQGMKMAIFDVSVVSSPKEMHKIVIGDRGTDSYALHDHKAFLYDRQKNLLVLPIELHEIKNKEDYAAREGSMPRYGEQTFQGAFVYKVTLENGFEERGRITHIGAEEERKSGYYYDSDSFVKRSLYIGNALYTLSEKMLKSNDLATLKELSEIKFD